MGALQNIPEHIHLRRRLDSDTSQHALLVNIADQVARVRLESRRLGGALGGGGGGGFVVETVEVAASGFELLDPFLGLGIFGGERAALVWFVSLVMALIYHGESG